MKIAFRMDDITPDMDWKSFEAFEQLFERYGCYPLLGIVPDNLDPKLSVDPAREAVMQFLKASQKSGARCVRIVHGKGYGSEGGHSVLKEKVRRWLKQCDCVMAFAEAQEIDGGSGALIVLLKGVAHAPYSAPRP